MAPKSTHDAARAKAAKQKKILLALTVPLLGALFFAYHTVTKLHQAPPPLTPAAATTPASSVPTATTATAPAVAPPSDTGLSSFPRLAAKDPFHDQGPHPSASAGSSTGSSQKQTPKPAKKQPMPPPTSAVVAVNGRLMAVALHATFPVTTDPLTNGLFRLAGLTAKTARIAVTGGSYANGRHALTLVVGTQVTLVNTADGRRYRLMLLPSGTVAPAAPVAIAAPTPTTTTPAGG